MTGQSPTPTDLQKMQIGEATDLGTLKRLAEAVETARARYEASPDGSLEESNAYLALDDADDAFDEAGQSATITLTLISLIEAQAAEIEEAKRLLTIFDNHLGADDHMWTDDSNIGSEWFDGGIRRSLTFGLFRQVRAFLASRTERADG